MNLYLAYYYNTETNPEYIVAEDYANAVKMYTKKYGQAPKTIKEVAVNILIQK